MSTVKNTKKQICQGRYGEKGTLVCWWWDYKLVHPLWKTIQQFHKKKKKIESPYNPAVAFKTIYMKEKKY